MSVFSYRPKIWVQWRELEFERVIPSDSEFFWFCLIVACFFVCGLVRNRLGPTGASPEGSEIFFWVIYILHEFFADRSDFLRQSGGEHHYLLFMRSLTEDLLDISSHV